MKKILKYMGLLFISAQLFATNAVLLQGKIEVTYKDIDGFSYKIPKEKRAGFFDSPKRIDQTLTNILNMKHVTMYLKENNIIDEVVIDQLVDERILASFPEYSRNDVSMQKELEFQKFRAYIFIEEVYKYMKKYIMNSVTEEDVIELANEKYIVNKQSYFRRESRNIDYFTVIYNDKNKQEKLVKAKELMSELRSSDFDFVQFKNKNNKDSDIEIIVGLDSYNFDKNHLKFSNFVFATDKLGLAENILEYNSRFIVVYIKKISPEKYLDFSEVKSTIVKGLIKERGQRKFGKLIAELTSEPVKVDKDAILSLRTRYQK